MPCTRAGAAFALQYRGEPRAVACVFGDAATSKGDVYEAFNLAGVWGLPVVFVITNNQWAISTPLAKQTASETLASSKPPARRTSKRASRGCSPAEPEPPSVMFDHLYAEPPAGARPTARRGIASHRRRAARRNAVA